MDKFHQRYSHNRGFTLVELLVTLVVASIVLTIAIPSLQTMMRGNRVVTYGNELVTSLNLARSEAIKSGGAVCICASSNQTSCGGTEWKNGWIIFRNPGGTCVVGAASNMVRVHDALTGNLTFTGPANVIYQPTGTAPVSSFSLTVNNYCDGAAARVVNISATGRPSIVKVCGTE